VQVQVAHVRSVVARAAQPDLRVHVGPIEIDEPAIVMDDLADLPHPLLEHTVRRRVRQHQRAELVLVLHRLGLEVRDVDVAAAVTRHRDHSHAGHDGSRRVRTVRRRGDQADLPPLVAHAAMVCADHEQPGVFSLSACVGLERYGIHAGDFREPALQL
jgi:hypothetical protein